MKKKISVIILSYNNLQFYKECLNSVFMQDYANIEIIFSDDGTNNFDKLEIEDYIKTNRRENITSFKVNYNEENLGIIKHLNKVIKMSKGEYIKLLAIDDALYDKQSISSAIHCLEKSRAEMCMGYTHFYDEKLKTKLEEGPSKAEVDIIKSGDKEELYKMVCISGKSLPTMGAFYSKVFFEKYGNYDENYLLMEDDTKMAEAIKKGLRIQFLDKVVYKHRRGGISAGNKINLAYEKDKERFLLEEVYPNIGISLIDNEKEYIVWGTSKAYDYNRKRLLKVGFKYFIDSNPEKQGETIDERKIHLPEKLLEEDKDNIIIIVCSSMYLEIENWLDSNGFIEKKNYINSRLVKSL